MPRVLELARQLEDEQDLQATLDRIVATAVAVIPGAQHASISEVRQRREVHTAASTSDVPRATDQAQYETAEGPCLYTLYEQETVRLTDMVTEQRWPAFTAKAAELGVGSMLCVQLYVEGGDLGALNLVSGQSDAFDDESEHVALLFASHAAVALSGAREQANLREAISTRDLIGQAKGILMERFAITDDEAFRLLATLSQTGNRKLRDVVRDVIGDVTRRAAARRAAPK